MMSIGELKVNDDLLPGGRLYPPHPWQHPVYGSTEAVAFETLIVEEQLVSVEETVSMVLGFNKRRRKAG